MLSFANLLVAPLLFFALGFLARILKSDFEIPTNMLKTLSIYLMVGIGLQGGIELVHGNFATSLLAVFVACILSVLQPILAALWLKATTSLDRLNIAAIAAHYGSVSVGTFLTAVSFLTLMGETYESYPLIMLAVMEFPAILVGLVMAQQAREKKTKSFSPFKLLYKALTNASVLVLVGSIFIGYIALPSSLDAIMPFYHGAFQGILTLFLLGMGVEAGIRIKEFRGLGWPLVAFGVGMPLVSGFVGVAVGSAVLALSAGGALLVGVLAASASYIAVPSAMRLAIPEANPSFYLTMSLGITFPFNVVFGIPLYWWFAKAITG